MAKVTFAQRMDKRFAQIALIGSKLNDYVHATGLMIIEHAMQHQDCRLALPLVKAMPASMRRTMLIAWFAKYTPIVVKLGDSEAVGFTSKYLKLKGDDAKRACWNIDGAKDEPFHMLAESTPEEKELSLADLIKMVQGLSKRISGKLDEGKIAANDTAKARRLIAVIDDAASADLTPRSVPVAPIAAVAPVKAKKAKNLGDAVANAADIDTPAKEVA